MNSKEFFDKVVEMREAQKLYFRTRTTTALEASKKKEKAIDEEIERVKSSLNPQPKQTNLFE